MSDPINAAAKEIHQALVKAPGPFIDEEEIAAIIRKHMGNLVFIGAELLERCKAEVASTTCICKFLCMISTSDKDDTVCPRCKTEAVIAKAEGRTP